MNVHDKINIKAEPWQYLTTAQYLQLIERDLMALAPYYKDRLIRQAKTVQDNESFKKIFGAYRYEIENNIKPTRT